PYHLFFTDADLVDYDTNLKVYPPLRDRASVDVLKKAVLDGTVDCIVSHHFPQDYDNKIIEFEYAKPGMAGLETIYAAVLTAVPELGAGRMVELLSAAPRRIFGLASPSVAVGQESSLSLFDPSGSTLVQENKTRSRSKNSAFLGRELKGAVLGIINGERVSLNEG
ncbi:MAG TPA: dihydroorotase, partial [Puia sp.]|nr:dihydroorotase [Puia sp.]